MLSIIVAFPNIEDAKNIKKVLNRNSIDVALACNSASKVISTANELDEGIIICSYRLPDMHYHELYRYLPKGFSMLLIASPQKLEECYNEEIVCLGMPIKSYDLISTIEMMTYNINRAKKKKKIPKQRKDEELQIIKRAKDLLMERNNMSESDAHRYIQKTSMDSGTNMVETAEMILTLQ